MEIREAQQSPISTTGLAAGIRKILRSRQYCHWLAPAFTGFSPPPSSNQILEFLRYYGQSDQGRTGQSLRWILLHTVLLPLRNYPFQLTATPVAVAESIALDHALPLHRLPRVPRAPLKNTITMSILSLGHHSCCDRMPDARETESRLRPGMPVHSFKLL